MNSRLLSILALMAAIPAVQAAEPQTGTGETDGYVLVWQDLFDSGELNHARWNIEVNGNGGGNAELQYYTDRPENVHVGDDGKGNGCLILTARREAYNNRNFTSGRVNTKNLFAFKHGKIEAAIRIPSTANGLWPAFWMMGNDYDQVGWPKCGETDIVEMGHSNGINNGVSDRFFNGACHWGQGWPNASYAQDCNKSYSLQDGEFHLFTLIWDENRVAMYVDLDKRSPQTPYFKMDIPANEPDNEWSAGNYFHKENFILFNLAIGGNFPGIHDAAGITALNDSNGQEASMYVNYVKVYQKGTPDESIFMLTPGDSTTGIAEAGAADTPGITIAGMQARADNADITVFNTTGTAVACGHGALGLEGLAKGVYFVRADRAGVYTTVKTLVK